MSKSLTKELFSKTKTLEARLVVRTCQYQIAKEGLSIIVASNDPMGIAEKTLKAMEECLP